MSNQRTTYLPVLSSFVSAACFAVFCNKYSDWADVWWVLLLSAATLALHLGVLIRRRRQVAPVVRFAFYAAVAASGAGMLLSTLTAPVVLQRAGAIAAISGLMVVGLIAQGVDRAARRLTFFSTAFLGVCAIAAGLQAGDSETRWFLAVFGAHLLIAAWASTAEQTRTLTWIILLTAFVVSVKLPDRPEGPLGAAALVMASGAAGLIAVQNRQRMLFVLFGFSGAILAHVLIRGQHAVLNTALVCMAVSTLGWAVATRRRRDHLALAAMTVFALATITAGVVMAGSTTLGLGLAYLATAIAVVLNAIFSWLPQLPVARQRWHYFLNGPDDATTPAASVAPQPQPAPAVAAPPAVSVAVAAARPRPAPAQRRPRRSKKRRR